MRKTKNTDAPRRDPMVLARMSELTAAGRARVEADWAEKKFRLDQVKEARRGLSGLEGQAAPTAAEAMAGSMKIVKPPRSTADGTLNTEPLPFDIPIVAGDPAATKVADGTDDTEGRADTGKFHPGPLVERDRAKGPWKP